MEYKVRTVKQGGEMVAMVTMVMAYHHFIQLESSQPWRWARNLWSKERISVFGEPLMLEYTFWVPQRSWIRLKKSRNWRLLEAEFKKMK